MPTLSAPISSLQVKGEAASKAVPVFPHPRHARPATCGAPGSFPNTHPFLTSQHPTPDDLVVCGSSGPSVPVRKMEHLSRVRTANFGITTMDAAFPDSQEPATAIFVEKPHFVLCGLPMGAKEIDHHLYVNEQRVGNFKTSAKAMYQARRGIKSGKSASESVISMSMSAPERHVINPDTNLPESEETSGKKSVPPIPPTTPVNNNFQLGVMKPRTRPSTSATNFNGSIRSVELENTYPNTLVKHKKMTLLNREKSNDSIDIQREHSGVSKRSVETVSESVVTNGLTVSTGMGARIITRSLGRGIINSYNNPYRNTKYRERLALSADKRLEFQHLDNYAKFQRQQGMNGKHFMTPRAVLRIPKPCSDTFLLQMMYDLNRPMSRRSASERPTDTVTVKDFEELVHSRTSSSLSKAHSNIDRFLHKPGSQTKSIKSVKSAKSITTTDILEEEPE